MHKIFITSNGLEVELCIPFFTWKCKQIGEVHKHNESCCELYAVDADNIFFLIAFKIMKLGIISGILCLF